MQTKQLVQTSANVVRITNIKAGDVYKRFDESYDDRTYYGVVRAVHNDGDKTIIESTEYCYKYNSLDVEHKVMNGTKDYILFPATPEELNLELDKAIAKSRREIEDAQATVEKHTKLIEEMEGLASGETLKNLTESSYKELTQAQYNDRVKELSI